MKFLFSNNARASLTTTLAIDGTTLSVDQGKGILFPSPSLGDGTASRCTLGDPSGSTLEIVQLVSRSTDQMTIQRAQEGTVAREWPAGTPFRLMPTSGVMDAFIQWEDLGVPYKTVDLGSGGGTISLDLGELPVGAPAVMIALTAGAPIQLSDITGATLGLIVILAVLESSSPVSIPLDQTPFFLSNISGNVGWPGVALSAISLFYNPLNASYKWVENGRTWRV